jgi:hypothetical protein
LGVLVARCVGWLVSRGFDSGFGFSSPSLFSSSSSSSPPPSCWRGRKGIAGTERGIRGGSSPADGWDPYMTVRTAGRGQRGLWLGPCSGRLGKSGPPRMFVIWVAQLWDWYTNFFIYFFYGPHEILQNYTFVAVAHGVRKWPTAVGAASSGPVGLTAAGHGGRSLPSGGSGPPGSVAGHGVCMDLPPWNAAVGFFFVNFNF